MRDIKAEYIRIDHKKSIQMGDLFVVIRVEPMLEIQLFELGAYWNGVLMGKYTVPKLKTLEPFDSFITHTRKKYELHREFSTHAGLQD
jgi:hypothetical protein